VVAPEERAPAVGVAVALTTAEPLIAGHAVASEDAALNDGVEPASSDGTGNNAAECDAEAGSIGSNCESPVGSISPLDVPAREPDVSTGFSVPTVSGATLASVVSAAFTDATGKLPFTAKLPRVDALPQFVAAIA
jgi:hypothetical protein